MKRGIVFILILLISLTFTFTLKASDEKGIVVTTKKELREALLENQSKIYVKIKKKAKLKLSGEHPNTEIIFDTKKLSLVNRGRFKKIIFNGLYLREEGRENEILVNSSKAKILVADGTELRKLELSKIGGEFYVISNGYTKDILVDRISSLSIKGSGKIDNIKLLGRKVELVTELPSNISVLNAAKIILNEGAKDTKIVSNEKELVEIIDRSEQVVSDKEPNKSVKNENINLFENRIFYPVQDEKDIYAPIVDEKLLYLINKNIDLKRSGTERITKEELSKIKAISTVLDTDGNPHFDDFITEEGKNSKEAKIVVLGSPRDLKDTDDFKFAVSYGIKSIAGLEYAKNLTMLQLDTNEISDLEPLKGLSKLKSLDLSRNRIVNLEPLKELKNLEYLKLYNNLIEDVTPLSFLTTLRGLDLHFNVTVLDGNRYTKGIVDVSSIINNLKELEYLDISANRIENVQGLENLTRLNNLDISGNRIGNYSKLQKLLIPLYKRMLEVGDVSVNFTSQNVEINDVYNVDSASIEIVSGFSGIGELGEEVANLYELPDYQIFQFIETSEDGINANYDTENNKIILTFTEEFLERNFGKLISLDLQLGSYDIGFWNLKGLKLKIDYRGFKIVSDEDISFYKSIFNKYSRFEKKYVNLTQEANAKFNIQNLPKQDSNFTEEDFLMLRSITIRDRDITDSLLYPLRFAKNLEEIKIELNSKELKREVANFNFITKLEKLTTFYYLNQDPDFTIRENIAEIDFKNNHLLKDVRIAKTNLSELSFLKDLDLENLSLQDNEISNISQICNMNNLIRLDLDNNKITDLGDIGNLVSLKTLYLRGNPVEDISSLKNLKALEALHLRGTSVYDISALEELPNLHRLYIDKIENLDKNYFDIVKKLKGLNTLFVGRINLDEFNYLKEFSIREAVKATFPEDEIRIISFDRLDLEVSNISNTSTVEVENVITDYDGIPVIGEEEEGIRFVGDKIDILNSDLARYKIFIEDSSGRGFGDYMQSAEISGYVYISVKEAG